MILERYRIEQDESALFEGLEAKFAHMLVRKRRRQRWGGVGCVCLARGACIARSLCVVRCSSGCERLGVRLSKHTQDCGFDDRDWAVGGAGGGGVRGGMGRGISGGGGGGRGVGGLDAAKDAAARKATKAEAKVKTRPPSSNMSVPRRRG